MGAAVGISAIAGLAGGGFQAFGQSLQGDEALRSAKKNAELARLAGSFARQRGQYRAGLIRMQARRVIGAQRAGFAAGNIDVSTGSAVSVAAQTRMMAELDVLMTEANAEREAWGYETQAEEFLIQGETAKRQSDMAAIGSLLGGGAGFASAVGRIR